MRYPAVLVLVAVATLAGCRGGGDSSSPAAPEPAAGKELTAAETSLLRTASRNVAAHCEPYLDPAQAEGGGEGLVVFENALLIANSAVADLVRDKPAAAFEGQYGLGSASLSVYARTMADQLQSCGNTGREAAAELRTAAGR